VAGVVGRAELLSAAFYLLAVLAYVGVKSQFLRVAAAAGFSIAAMLCKEQGVTALAVCAAFEWIFVQRLKPQDAWAAILSAEANIRRHFFGIKPRGQREALYSTGGLLRLISLGAVAAAAVAIRVSFMGGAPQFSRFDNPAAAAPVPARQLTFSYLSSYAAWLLLAPVDLLCDYSMRTIPLIESVNDTRNATTIAAALILAGLIRKASFSAQTSFSLALLLFPYLPASNLLFPVGFVVAERVLYLPSMGFSLLVAVGFQNLRAKLATEKGRRRLLWAALVLTVAAHAAKTTRRSEDWRDEMSLFTSGLAVTRDNAKLYNNVGHSLESTGRHEAALSFFRRASRAQPDDVGALLNAGRALGRLGRTEEAERAFREAQALGPRWPAAEKRTAAARVVPNHLHVYVALATLIARNESRLEEADAIYRQAIAMRSDYAQAHINRGDVLVRLGRAEDAEEAYRSALAVEGLADNPDLLYNLGAVLVGGGRISEALTCWDRALKEDPHHRPSLVASAALIQERAELSSLRPLAKRRLLIVADAGEADERVFFNLGMLAADDVQRGAAERWFRLSAQSASYDGATWPAAIINLALLLQDQGREVASIDLLVDLVAKRPDHARATLLLADALASKGRPSEAERLYRRASRLDPKSTRARHNLCVVMLDGGRLSDARDCLLDALRSAGPEDHYVRRHLDVVEARLAAVAAAAAHG